MTPTTQPKLFDVPKSEQQRSAVPAEPVAHRADPVTSYAAGERFYRTKLKGQMRLVLMGVQRWPGKTSAELGVLLGISRHDTARRLPNLQGKRLVRKGPARLCTACKNKSVTWYATQEPTFFEGRRQ